MMLRTRVLVASLIVAVPATMVLAYVADRQRTRDQEVALERVVRSQVNAATRERCESDPAWFMTGPLIGRPDFGIFVPPTPDALEPRARYAEQPFELFGYDEAFIGSGPATPRFPQELRAPMRTGEETASLPFSTGGGTGRQLVTDTGWIGSRCRYLLGRLAPPADQTGRRVRNVAGLFGIVALMAFAATVPTIVRIRRIARDARASVGDGYTSIAPERLKDELSSLVFVYNDAVTELQQRQARIDDLDTAIRRFVQSADEDIAGPLRTLETNVGSASLGQGAGGEAAAALVDDVRDLSARVDNLTAATRLRLLGSKPETSRVDLDALVARVVDRQVPFARARGVALETGLPDGHIAIDADEALVACALSNLVDNAIRYNQSGGVVRVTLTGAEDNRRFRLFVADTGRGVTDDLFRGLTAVRRFRGDEHRNRRPDGPGLGLAVAREVCDRFGLALDLKRPAAGGFEVEMSGPQA